MIKVAILGAGRIAHVHAKAVGAAGAKFVAVYDLFAQAAQKLAAIHGADAEPSVEAILARADVDAVIIATPTDTHVEFIVRCAQAGKAVLCEKPLALTAAEAQRCIDQIGHLPLTIQIGFNRRFDPSHRALQQALAGGDVGELEQLTITSRDPGPPPAEYLRHSGGLFKDMTIHDLDMARWLLPEPPISIYAQGDCLVNPEIGKLGDIDTATLFLRTAGGHQCTILNSRRAVYGYDQRIEVHAAAGMLISGNHHENSLLRYGAKNAGAPGPLQNFFLDRYADSYRLEIADFLDAVKAGRPASVTLQDGLDALLLAEAAQRSVETGLPVAL